MSEINHKTHKLVRLEHLPAFQSIYSSQYWGNGETLDEFIEYFTKLNETAKKAGIVKTRVDISIGDGYSDIEGWLQKTPEELEMDRIAAEKVNSSLEEREPKELKRLKEKYEGQTKA